MALKAPFSLVFRDGNVENKNDSRLKNREALPHLLELGVTAQAGRREIIEKLVVTDYCEGPITNYHPLPNEGNLWVFGKYIKGEPYYIKLQMGHHNRTAMCESFHPAKDELRFPFQQ